VRPLQEPALNTTNPVQMLVVPIEGVVGTQELALCHRALRQAEAEGLHVAFRLDNAGGDAESASDIQSLLDHVERARAKVTTTAIVRGHVRGGAAYLAVVCDQLWFLRDGDLGSIQPMPTLLEQLEQMTDEDAEKQRLRGFGEEMKQRLDRRRTKLSNDAARLCQGMVDPLLALVRVRLRERGVESQRIVDASELTGLQAAGAVIVSQEEITRPVVLTAAEADAVRLSNGMVQTMEQLCTDGLGLDPKSCFELEYSWAERMVGWLELLQPALLLLGLVLLVLEIKTPGVGLPGLLGAGFLALALFYNYLVGLAEITEILLFFLGLSALAVEIFLLPGVVIFGAVGFLSLVASLVLSRQTFVLPDSVSQQEILFDNLLQLAVLFIAVLVSASLMWRVLPRIPLLNRLYLPPPVPPGAAAVQLGDPAAAQKIAALVGKTARAATVLRPSGAVELDGERYDVVTDGDFVEAGTLVRIVAVHGNRIVVERALPDSQRGSIGVILLIAIVGIALLIGEVFFVSFGVLTLLSGTALISAVFLAFQEGQALGIGFLVGEAILAPIALWWAFRALPHTRLGRALMLEGPRPEEVSGGATSRELATLLHRRGTALSSLRPAGFARIDGHKIDVQTRGEMLDQGCLIEVVEVVGNRVVVRQAVAAPTDEPHSKVNP
jgi:membrane-bound serine protease (ClpP class)